MSRLLWSPSEEQIKKSNMFAFMQTINSKYGTQLENYSELHQWSIDHIAEFWEEVWKLGDVIHSQPYSQVVDDPYRMPGAKWFSGARMNYAENLLRYRDDRTALVFKREAGALNSMSYRELYNEVAQVAESLKELGVKPGDRVSAVMPNIPQTITAMLAAVSLGAIWSSCSPDFGTQSVLDRLAQVKPKVLFTTDGYTFKGKPIDLIPRLSEITGGLPSLEKVIVVPQISDASGIDPLPDAVLYDDFKSSKTDLTITFEQMPADHPLYVMYSSGTTGKPKCIVQSAGGILMNQLNEHLLHVDLSRDDTIFYFTTCGWMMWNWLIGALTVGAKVVLYEGNPFHPGDDALWELAEETETTVFGISAGYIDALQKTGIKPKERFKLANLRAVLSTGSPLSEEGFEFINREIKTNMQIASISGGTDINGCFALGNPMLPVYSGEIQCLGLGKKVEAYDPEGNPIFEEKGELICSAAFPSMPIYFWDDPDQDKYRAAYFEVYPNKWRHGDFIRITERGGMVIYGRSDATLNPGGVRIGTAEIYRVLSRIYEIEDSVVVDHNLNNTIRIVLFVKLAVADDWSEGLQDRIKKEIREKCSPRHVPAAIFPVSGIPYTRNMKKVEIAVKNVIHNLPVKNKEALMNPEVLDEFARLISTVS